jgi:predicted Zn-dependent protease
MRNLNLRAILAMALLVLVAGCATKPPPEPPGPPIDIYLLPVDDFPFEFTDHLARRLSVELNLKVRASLPMGVGDLKELPNSSQLACEDIIARANEIGLRLPNKNQRFVVIALTTRDINERSQSLRFLFAKSDLATQTSVISNARMFASTPSTEGTQAQVGLRIYKMTKRTIGEQYFGLPRTANIADIMYAPIMSLEDIDAMGIDYKGLQR